MSMTEQDQTTEETREQPDMLVREFDASLSAGDGRTIDMRIVPFGETATVFDGHGGVPFGQPYEEEWLPGVFDKQLRAADKIYLNFQHEPGLRGIIGKGMALRSEGDGYHASFRLLEGDDCDKALQLVHEDVLTGASIEVPMRTVKSIRSRNGVVQRVKAHLDSVALCRMGAFKSAVVTAVREAEIFDATEAIPPPDLDVLREAKAMGIALPEGMEELLARAYTETPWDGSPSRWATAEAYCSASAIDLNPAGKSKAKSLCHLPYKEPGSGTINLNGVRAALARIGQGFPQDATQAQRDAAKATLQRILDNNK